MLYIIQMSRISGPPRSVFRLEVERYDLIPSMKYVWLDVDPVRKTNLELAISSKLHL